MKQVWQSQARRIDALSLRERVIMFVSVAVAVAAAADAVVLSPAFAERRQLASQMRAEAAQVEALRVQLAARSSQRPDDTPQGRQRAALTQARADERALDAQIRAQFAGREEMARLPAVLDQLLRQHDRLTLARLSTATATAPTPAAAANATSTLRWQGVDLSVAGSYPDLVQYLDDIERELPGLRWGPLQIEAPAMPPVLHVRLMLPGEAP